MILVINAGSSSIKFQLYKKNNDNFEVICKGLAERIYLDGGIFTLKFNNKEYKINQDLEDHKAAARLLIEKLKEYKIINDFSDIKGIGHRIVHGGELFNQSIIINDEVLAQIKKMIILAPLHNGPAIDAIDAFRSIISVPNVAVFDTSFHTTMPEENYLYSVPYEWYRDFQVRRYGFHGISFRYITKRLAEVINKDINTVNAVICHLGNGASVCAVKNGKSYNTTMGLTPLEGLIMGSRSGDIDPSIPNYIAAQTQMNITEITSILNKKSGLLGITGISSDLRDIISDSDQGGERSILALKMTAKRIAKYVISYLNEIGGKIDALVFTAGIGENSWEMRELVAKELSLVNLDLNYQINREQAFESEKLISGPKADFSVYVIRTNEEEVICNDAYNLVNE